MCYNEPDNHEHTDSLLLKVAETYDQYRIGKVPLKAVDDAYDKWKGITKPNRHAALVNVMIAARKYVLAANEMSWAEAGELHAKAIRQALLAYDIEMEYKDVD